MLANELVTVFHPHPHLLQALNIGSMRKPFDRLILHQVLILHYPGVAATGQVLWNYVVSLAVHQQYWHLPQVDQLGMGQCLSTQSNASRWRLAESESVMQGHACPLAKSADINSMSRVYPTLSLPKNHLVLHKAVEVIHIHTFISFLFLIISQITLLVPGRLLCAAIQTGTTGRLRKDHAASMIER